MHLSPVDWEWRLEANSIPQARSLALQADPQGLGTGWSIAFAPQMAAQTGDPAGPDQRRRRDSGWRVAVNRDVSRPPLGRIQDPIARRVGGRPPQRGQVLNPPSDAQVQGQGQFQAFHADCSIHSDAGSNLRDQDVWNRQGLEDIFRIGSGELGLGHGLAVRPVAVKGFQFGDFGGALVLTDEGADTLEHNVDLAVAQDDAEIVVDPTHRVCAGMLA